VIHEIEVPYSLGKRRKSKMVELDVNMLRLQTSVYTHNVRLVRDVIMTESLGAITVFLQSNEFFYHFHFCLSTLVKHAWRKENKLFTSIVYNFCCGFDRM